MEMSSYPAFVRKKQTSRLIKLPGEIFNMVTSHLGDVAYASLSLTCWRLLDILTPTRRFDLRNYQLRRFLKLLEKDSTVGDHLWFCNHCGKLHPFAKWRGVQMMLDDLTSWSYSTCPRAKRIPISKRRLLSLPMSNLVLGFQHARLFMNHHLYGPTCGIPVRSFIINRGFGTDDGLLHIMQSATARIINDRLIVRCVHTVTPVDVFAPAHKFREFLKRCDVRVCKHVYLGAWSEDLNAYAPPELRPQKENGTRGAIASSPISCERCLTDFETTIETKEYSWSSSRKGLSVTVYSYHHLGDGRLVGYRYPLNFYELPASSIRQDWIQSDL